MNRHRLLASAVALALVGLLASFIIKYDSIRWRVELVRGAVLDWRSSAPDTLPTAVAEQAAVKSQSSAIAPQFEHTAASPNPTSIPPQTPAPTATPYPLVEPPTAVALDAPKWEKQGINNCGPATLSMYLRYYGWQGTQADIAKVVHPNERDKNVRWDELVYYVKTNAGWLDALFRVGGATDQMKRFIANGFPVVIETGYELDVGWVGHYLLLTGYDDELGVFIAQDATAGPNRKMSYEQIDKYWQQFNRLYIVVYHPNDEAKVMALLGDDADEALNRQNALGIAERETETDPQNTFAWFNLGSNLAYFDRYEEAASAFDTARELGLPKRMLFYQFGPYRAYFNVGRYTDVIELSSYTLDYRPDLEESYFWRGWAEYMLGDRNSAIINFREALTVNPTFNDAKLALDSIGATP